MSGHLREALRSWPMTRHQRHEAPLEVEDVLVVEAPLEIVIGGEVLAVTMRTPGHDVELAVGLLRAEGVLQHPDEVLESEAVGDRVELELAAEALARRERARRTMFMSSACGICGKVAIQQVLERVPLVEGGASLRADQLWQLPELLRKSQPAFHRSGGLHAAALFHRSGELRLCREDVGRHNALDKVLGATFGELPAPLSDHLVLVSGRASYELVAKAATLGVPFMAAVSAPSSLAVDLARVVGMTLVGFLRDDRLNVYTHPERVVRA